jgi:hypothetical protein
MVEEIIFRERPSIRLLLFLHHLVFRRFAA